MINNLLKKINNKFLSSNNYEFYDNAIIFDSNNEKYVIKNNNGAILGIYNYLNSRGFDYIPNILDSDNDSYLYKYEYDYKIPEEQRAKDLIKLLALLHNKTVYYKDVSIDEFKEIYEKLSYQIDNTYKYYEDVISMIENTIYPSPAEYMLERNISTIFNCLDFSKQTLEGWYEIVSNSLKKREVLIHNNIDINNLIINDKKTLISFDNAKRDLCIYDFIKFFKENYNKYDFNELYNEYIKKFPLLKEEKLLFYTLLFIPKKIYFDKNEIKALKNVTDLCNYLYKANGLFMENEAKNTKKQDHEINKKQENMKPST